VEQVTVLAFELYDPVQDSYVPARGLATVETIAKEGGKLIQSVSKRVQASELNERGRYHEKPVAP
jgi:hypothetical protein